MRIVMFILTLLLGSGPAAAAPCGSGSLGDYLALGSTGCDIAAGGGSIHVADFTLLPIPAAATPIAAGDISVTPIADGGLPGLLFGGSLSVAAGEFIDAVFGFTVTGAGLKSASLLLTGSSATLDGIVTAVENLCLGAAFPGGPGSCAMAEPAHLVLAGELALPGDESSLAGFGAESLLGLIIDLGIDAGALGEAGFGSLAARFEPTAARIPAPATAVLALTGLTLAAFYRRRRVRR